jgi:hypothetical protein
VQRLLPSTRQIFFTLIKRTTAVDLYQMDKNIHGAAEALEANDFYTIKASFN